MERIKETSEILSQPPKKGLDLEFRALKFGYCEFEPILSSVGFEFLHLHLYRTCIEDYNSGIRILLASICSKDILKVGHISQKIENLTRQINLYHCFFDSVVTSVAKIQAPSGNFFKKIERNFGGFSNFVTCLKRKIELSNGVSEWIFVTSDKLTRNMRIKDDTDKVNFEDEPLVLSLSLNYRLTTSLVGVEGRVQALLGLLSIVDWAVIENRLNTF